MLKGKVEQAIRFLEDVLTRKNIGIIVFLALVCAAAFFFFEPSRQDAVSKFIFNPFWPLTLIAFETWRNQVDEKTTQRTEKILGKLQAVLNDGNANHDPGYLLTIIEERDGELSALKAGKYIEDEISKNNPLK